MIATLEDLNGPKDFMTEAPKVVIMGTTREKHEHITLLQPLKHFKDLEIEIKM